LILRRRKKQKEEQEQEENCLDLLLHFAICNTLAIVEAFGPSTYVRKWAEETKQLRPKEWRNKEEEEDEEDEEENQEGSSSERQTLKLSPCVFFVFWLVSCCSRLAGCIKWTHASFLPLVVATSIQKGMREGERVFESGRIQGRRERERESPASRDEWRDG
jgi:hypothetical protein